MSIEKLCKELESQIVSAYESGVTLEEAEKLAAKFLYAQIQVSNHLQTADLDARMRKSGLKTIRASIYTDICAKAEKKPTVDALEHMLNLDPTVSEEQFELDTAESNKNGLERYYDIFVNAHIYFRGVAKGNFNG